LNVNFLSIKVGDVSGASGLKSENLSQRTRYYSLGTMDDELPIGFKSLTNFNMEQDITLEGYQLIIKFDPEMAYPDRVIDYSKSQEGTVMESDQLVIIDNEIRISYSGLLPIRLNKGDKLFSIVWNNLKKSKVSELITETDFNTNEIYTSAYSKYPVVIHINRSERNNANPEIEDFRRAPNPFTETCQFSFLANSEIDAYLEIVDSNGKILLSKWTPTIKGINRLNISSNQLGGPGIYYYKFVVGDFLKKGKMIQSK
ncbi:MAG: T9SS type A sorting domain-containing protein, partial [Saprospiraceae bacterium]